MRYMRRGGWASKYKAHIVAMTLIGFWHGANWTFIVFGLYWGAVIAFYLYGAERMAEANAPGRLQRTWAAFPAARPDSIGVAAMFIVACVGWVFFRAASIDDAWHVLSHAFSTIGESTVLRVDVARESILWMLIAGTLDRGVALSESPAPVCRTQRRPGPRHRLALRADCRDPVFIHRCARGRRTTLYLFSVLTPGIDRAPRCRSAVKCTFHAFYRSCHTGLAGSIRQLGPPAKSGPSNLTKAGASPSTTHA